VFVIQRFPFMIQVLVILVLLVAVVATDSSRSPS
jgi:hypothetical protein